MLQCLSMNNTERTGEILIFSKSFFWALYPIVASILVFYLSPIFALAISTLAAAIFFAILLTIQKKWHELLIRPAWKYLLPMILLLGILFYGLQFFALQYTTPGNVAIISLMEVFFTMFLLGAVTSIEKLSKITIVGGILMVIGAFFVIFQGTLTQNPGDLLVLLATTLPPFANVFAKKARKYMGSASIMFARSIIAGLFLICLAWAWGDIPTTMPSWNIIGLIGINGFLILGLSTILWIEGIHRIQISKAISLASITPAITLLFVYIILKQPPTIFQLLGLVPITLGVFLLTRKKVNIETL